MYQMRTCNSHRDNILKWDHDVSACNIVNTLWPHFECGHNVFKMLQAVSPQIKLWMNSTCSPRCIYEVHAEHILKCPHHDFRREPTRHIINVTRLAHRTCLRHCSRIEAELKACTSNWTCGSGPTQARHERVLLFCSASYHFQVNKLLILFIRIILFINIYIQIICAKKMSFTCLFWGVDGGVGGCALGR